MKIGSTTLLILLSGVHLAQALSCHKCADDISFSDCLANLETNSCSAGFNQCFNMKYFVKKSTGEEILYLNKQCGLDFVCNNPDPKFVCNLKNNTITSEGNEMINCTSRCCTTDMCNNDDMPTAPPGGNTASSAPLTGAASTVAASNHTGNNTNIVPSSPRPTTHAECGTGVIKMPPRMLIALVEMLQLALKLM